MMEERSPGEPVDMDALARESRALREAADRLLRELGIVEQWQQYGEVELAGSYRWDLMLGSDIDLYVVNPAADLDLALEIFTRFVRQGNFLAFAFIDSVRGKPVWADPASYPEGYYVGMARNFHGREWKIETWLLRSRLPHPDWLEKALTEDQRRAILRLKHLRNTGHFQAGSYDIYKAVLLGDAASPAEVRQWLLKQKDQ
jgi:hypothetical protein